ncbi:efflux RND transporter periplasmic adaptor subunit [Aquimarina hainanensis]|uniref:Efflux RND transporter periplasmic adaptor subunit n=1 Tax=Aquimarina hainanensis TaxID=1578017 RepID=A0ABW5NC23_9FLAO|nr:HlyD family efflux transporter periplasmic adaptor subunit [Aquimarina sp. TRL1]QKX06630.1 HlyD family efflux transporter periplasmic adaptor subunit [Aquimarina sp. TRL1]
MDRQRIPNKNKKRKRILMLGIPLLVVVSILLMNLTRKKQVNIKREMISIKEVKRGDFEDVVLFNSVVVPKNTILLNVIQGGSVAEIFAENGQEVQKGMPLVRIYNPTAELNFLTQETAIVEQINNLRNIRATIKNQQLNLDQQLLQIDNDYKNASRQYQIDTVLYTKQVISRNQYQTSKQEFDYQKDRNEAIKTSVTQEKTDRKIQLSRINTSIQNMEKSLELLKKNKENFIIKAPVDGLLSSFNLTIGQNYNQGDAIGKIDILDGYKLTAKIDEYYISKINEGIKGKINSQAIDFDIEVLKVDPEVINGQFEVELAFHLDSLPKTIKRGMSVKTKLFLSNNKKAVLIPKGMFYQSTNGNWIFLLKNETTAIKKAIKIGRENPFYYEVLEGLKEGDQVITSNYEDFLNIEQINIKQ